MFIQISAVRLPRELSNPERLKGFGYAEFDDVESLLRALSLNEEVRTSGQSSRTELVFNLRIFWPHGGACHPSHNQDAGSQLCNAQQCCHINPSSYSL